MATEGSVEPMEVKEERPAPAGDGPPPIPGESVAPSYIDMTGMETKKESKLTKFRYFLYNPNTKRVLGRTGLSWLQILIFYILYYFFVFTYFALWLIVLIQSSGTLKPSITTSTALEPEILSSATGLSVFPTAPPTLNAEDPYARKQSTTIFYDLNNAASWMVYRDRLDKVVNSISYTIPGNLGNCTSANNYGYSMGSPCVLIRFNHVFDWEPVAMEKLWDYVESNYKTDSPTYRETKAYLDSLKNHPVYSTNLNTFLKENVGIRCTRDGPDLGSIGTLSYFPAPGIPVNIFKKGVELQKNDEYMKNKAKRWAWTPYIFVQFNQPKQNVLIPVICKSFEQDMDLAFAREGVGAVRFSFFIQKK